MTMLPFLGLVNLQAINIACQYGRHNHVSDQVFEVEVDTTSLSRVICVY